MVAPERDPAPAVVDQLAERDALLERALRQSRRQKKICLKETNDIK